MTKPLKDIRVLIVDDMKTMTEIVGKYLEWMEIEDLVYAYDGTDAWKKLIDFHSKEKPVDLCIVDWNMPKTTGLDLLRKMKANELYKNIPFIMLSGEIGEKYLQLAYDEGINEYFEKPFTKDIFHKKMSKFLDKHL
jgi:two-component system, chemotaxis family, chemotaxis protein CheY